ncbi:hypothetical protein WN944_016809 [Citrus x changshan-huyou]|uniref:Uncharacterized protein n=1 Tax=Citrus x changshan-huyou TaxID=2935761 RepID=A0AAP0QKP8_9ROSI
MIAMENRAQWTAFEQIQSHIVASTNPTGLRRFTWVGGVEGVSGCKETSADKSKLLVNIVEAGIHECVGKD